MRTDGYVVEVLPDLGATRSAVDELVSAGLANPTLRQRVERNAHHAVDFDADAYFGRAVVIGVLAGMPLGALATAGLVAIGTLIAGDGVGAGIIAGLAAGTFLGVLFGGAAGVAASNRAVETAALIDEIPVQGDEVILAVRATGHEAEVDALLRRHGGHPVVGASLAA